MVFLATVETGALEFVLLGAFVFSWASGGSSPWVAFLGRGRTVVRRLLPLPVESNGHVAVFSQFHGERLDRSGSSTAAEESVQVLEFQPVESRQSVAKQVDFSLGLASCRLPGGRRSASSRIRNVLGP